MGDLLIRDIPDSLKRDLSDVALQTGRSMSDEVKAMIRKGVAAHKADKSQPSSKNAYEQIREAFADIPDEEREEFAKIMDEIEADRKTNFGRPFSFEE